MFLLYLEYLRALYYLKKEKVYLKFPSLKRRIEQYCELFFFNCEIIINKKICLHHSQLFII